MEESVTGFGEVDDEVEIYASGVPVTVGNVGFIPFAYLPPGAS